MDSVGFVTERHQLTVTAWAGVRDRTGALQRLLPHHTTKDNNF